MNGYENLCMNCMGDTGGEPVCPHCGYDTEEKQQAPFLPLGSTLQERYIVGKAQKSNGEGVSYIGFDTVQKAPVHIREFFPQNLASRSEDGNMVGIIAGCEIIFHEYLGDFLEYSRAVARFRELSAVIPTYDIFEENNTAYIITEWVDSITLSEFIRRSGGSINWNTARPLFMPVLSTLSSLHAAGIRHLGICPENLLIMRNGKMKLSGFGIEAVRQNDTDIKPELYTGCAAVEQYVMGYNPNEATDVYGFGASLFFALTGNLPMDALKRRTDGRLLIPTTILRQLPPHVVSALANALQVNADKRTQTFERFRAELSAAPTVTAVMDEVAAPPKPAAPQNRYGVNKNKKKGLPNIAWALISGAAALIVFTLIGLAWLAGSNSASQGSSADDSGTSSVASGPDALSSVNAAAQKEQIDVPNLVNQKYADVKAAAQKSGQYGVLLSSEEYNDTVAAGNIISQTPQSGKMSKGGSIVVVVSKGPAKRKLPDIQNLSLADASTKVTQAGFVPSKIEDYSDTVKKGYAIGYKDAKAGQTLDAGSQVTIVISKGKNPSASQPAQ